MKKVGYVLSGGGTRGFAHLGIIQYLEELKIYPHAISGTSAGAIAGSLYAAGKNPSEILQIMKDNISFGWSSINFRQNGFLSMDMLRKVLKNIFVEDDFKTLKIPFHATATDLNKGKEITFSEGPLIEAVIASCSVPVVFNSVQMGNHLLVDGGLVNNFPVEPLLSNCDIIIGSYVNKLEEGISNHSSFKMVNYLDRCFHLAISKNVYAKTHLCDVFIESPLHAYNMYDVKAADAIFEIGYKTAREYGEELNKLVEKLNETD
ncbi:MAG: patatin-like phospholipase family protein [Sediminibacterium sp.]|nr:patatin-like phospholipase family protein [Sediminibacterium sp.]